MYAGIVEFDVGVYVRGTVGFDVGIVEFSVGMYVGIIIGFDVDMFVGILLYLSLKLLVYLLVNILDLE